jgi:hypothetical protein
MKKSLLVLNKDDNHLICKEVYYLKSNYKIKYLDHLDLCEPKIDDKSFYRYPNISFSRDKVEVLKDKNNISIKRSEAKSDYQIISENYLKKVSGQYSFIYEEHRDSYTYLVNETIVKYDDYDCVYVHPGCHGMSRRENSHVSYTRNYLLIDEKLAQCKTLVSDVYMNAQCDKHLNVIGEDDYENLVSILKSDKVLALEMMANCNFEKSKDIITYLCYKYSGIIYYAKNRNHVSVKSLMNKVGSLPASWNTYAIGTIVQRLSENKGLTKFILHKLFEEWKTMVGSAHYFNGPIKIKQVVIDPEILKTIVDLRGE